MELRKLEFWKIAEVKSGDFSKTSHTAPREATVTRGLKN